MGDVNNGMPGHRILNTSEIARRLFPVQELPAGGLAVFTPEQGKHIVFLPMPPKPDAKTKTWSVVSMYDETMILGQVKWFSQWRKYSFFPEKDTIFEERCMRDIAGFCEKQTLIHGHVLKSLKEKAGGA